MIPLSSTWIMLPLPLLYSLEFGIRCLTVCLFCFLRSNMQGALHDMTDYDLMADMNNRDDWYGDSGMDTERKTKRTGFEVWCDTTFYAEPVHRLISGLERAVHTLFLAVDCWVGCFARVRFVFLYFSNSLKYPSHLNINHAICCGLLIRVKRGSNTGRLDWSCLLIFVLDGPTSSHVSTVIVLWYT